MSDLGDTNRDVQRANSIAAILRTKKLVAFAAAAKATLATALTGSNNDLDFTAEHSGSHGNDITIRYKDPGALSQALSVVVDGSDIVVNLATGAGTNEQQTVTLVATGGFFTLSFRDQSTSKLAYNITAANLKLALEGVQTIGSGNVDVSGSAGGPYTITFKGALAATNVPALVADANHLLPYKPKVEIVEAIKGTGSVNEVQKVRVQNATAGTFTLTFSGQTTSALAYNISAANMLTALQALSNWNDSAGAVTKSGSEYTITFSGTGLTHTDQPLLTANISGLRASVAINTTVPGVAYAITSTAAQIATAIAASDAADALVDVANHAANDGSGVVTAMAVTHLAGGNDGLGSRATQATYTTVLTGANNDLVFTAVPTGIDGNGITVVYVDPGGVTAALSVVVDVADRVITVNLARAASAISSTAAQIKTAIDANTDAHALVTVANSGADTGAGVVTAMSAQQLSGGGSGGRIDLFQISGHVLASVLAVSTETPVGSSATFKVRSTDTADNLIGVAVTAENLAAGRMADKTGLVTAGTPPVTDPVSVVTDGEKIYAAISTADITDGTIAFYCYYKKLENGATVRPL